MVDEVFYKNCLSAIVHELRAKIVVDYVNVWFLLLIKGSIMHLNGDVILDATTVWSCLVMPLRCPFCI
jgi:hypothetical protein